MRRPPAIMLWSFMVWSFTVWPLGLMAAAVPAMAQAGSELRISGQWIRALGIGSLPAAGYFTLHNDTAGAVRLLGASSPDCASLSLHQTVREHVQSHRSALDPSNPADAGTAEMPGMSMMQPVESLVIPGHAAIRFAPGAYHLMCEQPSGRVRAGGMISIRLQFADGFVLERGFPVRDARARPPSD